MIQRSAWLWALAGVLLSIHPVFAQLSPRLQGCSPYSETAKRIETPRPPRIIVDEVKFDPSIQLSDQMQTELAQVVKQARERARPGWFDEVLEIGVRGTLEDEGYLRMNDTGEVEVKSTDSEFQHVSVILRVEPGAQYRLGEVTFRSANPDEALVFPREELRSLVPLSEGDLFSATRIREALDVLKKHYEAKGYIDFVAEPQITFDDMNQRIALDIVLDQQKQFRIGKIKVLSVDPDLRSLVESEFKPGDIVNTQAIEDFYKENRSALPPDASAEDVRIEHGNVKARQANLTFFLLTCSQFRSTLDP